MKVPTSWIVPVGSALILLGTSGAGPVVAGESDTAFPAGPSAAADSFEHLGCATCHSTGTISMPGGGPDLGKMELRMSFHEGAAQLWNHAPVMHDRMEEMHVRPSEFSGEELRSVVAFFTVYKYYVGRVGHAGRADRGELIFRTKRCDVCHSVEPGIESDGPNLSETEENHTILGIAQSMWNHGPAMQESTERHLLPRPHFREREITDLLAYLVTMNSPASDTLAYIEPGDPARGAVVFEEHGCIQCHAIHGRGGLSRDAARDYRPPDLGEDGGELLRDHTDIVATMWNHAVPMWNQMRAEGIQSDPFEETELADLVAYLFFLNFVDQPGDQARGKEIFEQRGCARCHHSDDPDRAAITGSSNETAADVIALMWLKSPKMREMSEHEDLAWPTLEEGEMVHLIEYVMELRRSDRFDPGFEVIPEE